MYVDIFCFRFTLSEMEKECGSEDDWEWDREGYSLSCEMNLDGFGEVYEYLGPSIDISDGLLYMLGEVEGMRFSLDWDE